MDSGKNVCGIAPNVHWLGSQQNDNYSDTSAFNIQFNRFVTMNAAWKKLFEQKPRVEKDKTKNDYKNRWTYEEWKQKCFEETHPLSCYWCDERFTDFEAIARHTIREHKFHCNECIKKYESFEAFNEHIKRCIVMQRVYSDTV